MSPAELTAEIRELGQRFPDSRSATIPALRLVQEANGGWLTARVVRAGRRRHSA